LAAEYPQAHQGKVFTHGELGRMILDALRNVTIAGSMKMRQRHYFPLGNPFRQQRPHIRFIQQRRKQ